MNILFLTSAAPKRGGFSTSEKRPPIGMGFLMATLKQNGHTIYFSDEYLQPSTILETDFLARKQIDYVGIYSNTICYQSTLQMFEILQKQREQKKWTGKIMVGGPHTSVGADSIPDYVDYVLIGEGEITVPKIVNGDINQRIIVGEKVKEMDDIPFPAWEEFIHRPYTWRDHWNAMEMPVYPMNTSRGCPFSCTFCSVNAVWGRTYRYMSADRIIDEILFLVKYYGAKGIFFREDHFTFSKKRTVDFCEKLLKKNIKIEWVCETRADQLDDYEYQKLLKDAGCRYMYIGVESGSPRMLRFFNKGETREQFIKAFEVSKRVGIKTHASFVVSAPTETDEDIFMTNQLIDIIKPNSLSKNVYVGLPGSYLYDYVIKNNLYEYKDKNGILYLKGYLDSVEKYYSNNQYFKVY